MNQPQVCNVALTTAFLWSFWTMRNSYEGLYSLSIVVPQYLRGDWVQDPLQIPKSEEAQICSLYANTKKWCSNHI